MLNGMIADNFKIWIQSKINENKTWIYDFDRDCFFGYDNKHKITIHRTRGVIVYESLISAGIMKNSGVQFNDGSRQIVFYGENEMHNYNAMIAKIEQRFNSQADRTMEIH